MTDTPLPSNLVEHTPSILAGAFALITLLVGVTGVLLREWWRSRLEREREEKNEVAAALRELGEQIAALGGRFDHTADRIFTRLSEVEAAQRGQSERCLALHGHVPGWDGVTDRRRAPRGAEG